MIKNIAVLLMVGTLVSGCASFNCSGWEKFRPSRNDTEQTKAQALKHNNYGRAQGCWR